MNDLIARQKAIDFLGEEPEVWYGKPEEYAVREQWRADVLSIKAVPSVEQEPEHAHWIYWYEDGVKRCKCSSCLTSYGCMDTPFCPNCGRRMDGEQ